MIVYDKNIFGSNREIDSNGYLRVDSCNITKTQVAPYLGREIPGWQEMGLEAEKIYYVLRPEEELKKAVPTFNNLPLTREHIEVDVDNVPKEKIVGSLGDHTEFVDGYLRNNLIIYDKKDIDLVMSGKKKELSCGYRYTPVRMAGDYKGQHYDFIMKDIVGNHVALVKEGRAGHDVVVSDTIDKVKEKFMSLFRKKEVVCDEFVESEHPRAENGQFTNKSGGSSLKGNKDVENYWQGSGSKESQQSGKIGVMQKQLEDLKKMHKEILGKPMYVSLEDQEKAKYLEKDIKNLEDEIKKQKEQGYADWWNGLSEQDKKDAIMGLADKDPEIKELMGEKLYKDISENGKQDVFKSDLTHHIVRKNDPNYGAQLSAAKNELKKAISDFEKNVANQDDKYKWIEQARLDKAKADLERLEKFEKENNKEESSKEALRENPSAEEMQKFAERQREILTAHNARWERYEKEMEEKRKKYIDLMLSNNPSREELQKMSQENEAFQKEMSGSLEKQRDEEMQKLEAEIIYPTRINKFNRMIKENEEAIKKLDEEFKSKDYSEAEKAQKLKSVKGTLEWATGERDRMKNLMDKYMPKNTTNDSKLDAKQEKVGVVMKEFKDGELKSGSGEKVTDPKQAIAIALSEADKMAKDKDIPDEQEKPQKAGDENALVKGEEEMTEEVKEALAEKEVEKVEEAEDACGKAKDEKDEKLESKKDFAEGVKYGEEKEKEEPKKLDSEHESEGAKKADKKKAEEEAEDEDEEKKDDKMAKDSALAMDIDAIKEAVREEMKADFRAREDARKAVRSIVGDVNVMAFDSAEDIYKFACEQAGMDINEIASYKDAFKGLTAGKSRLALDASSISGSNEECFKDIRIA